jgi:hypothetical protein
MPPSPLDRGQSPAAHADPAQGNIIHGVYVANVRGVKASPGVSGLLIVSGNRGGKDGFFASFRMTTPGWGADHNRG